MSRTIVGQSEASVNQHAVLVRRGAGRLFDDQKHYQSPRSLFDLQKRLSTDTQSWRADEQADCVVTRDVCQPTCSLGTSMSRAIV